MTKAKNGSPGAVRSLPQQTSGKQRPKRLEQVVLQFEVLSRRNSNDQKATRRQGLAKRADCFPWGGNMLERLERGDHAKSLPFAKKAGEGSTDRIPSSP